MVAKGYERQQKANIHIPFQFVKNSYFKFLQGNVATLYVGKLYPALQLIYPRHCTSISIKIGRVL